MENYEKPTNHLHAPIKTTTNAEPPGKATTKQKYNKKLLRPAGNQKVNQKYLEMRQQEWSEDPRETNKSSSHN